MFDFNLQPSWVREKKGERESEREKEREKGELSSLFERGELSPHFFPKPSTKKARLEIGNGGRPPTKIPVIAGIP